MPRMFHITNVAWDTDGEVVKNLPSQCLIDVYGELSESTFADTLSDHYGWCVQDGFNYEELLDDVEHSDEKMALFRSLPLLRSDEPQ